MKKYIIYLIIGMVFVGGGSLLAQKYQPKYLREDNKIFKDLTERTTDNGWITFKKEAKLNPNSFFKDYATPWSVSSQTAAN